MEMPRFRDEVPGDLVRDGREVVLRDGHSREHAFRGLGALLKRTVLRKDAFDDFCCE